MKLKYTSDGAIYSLEVDGVKVDDIQIEKLQNIIKTVVDKIEYRGSLEELLSNIIEMEGEWTESDYCDGVDTFELEI